MSKTKKIWLGILSFSPLVIMMFFVGVIIMFYMKIIFWSLDGSISQIPTDMIVGNMIVYIILITMLAFLVNIITFATVIIFTICIVKNKRIVDSTKILYLIGLYFLTTIIPILYFFIEVVGKDDLQEKNLNI